jgi:hypothetical protein
MIFAGETEVLGETLPSATLSTTNPTWIDPGANPGLRGERPATNRLSHGTAYNVIYYTILVHPGASGHIKVDYYICAVGDVIV